jgi:hypothetical protein
MGDGVDGKALEGLVWNSQQLCRGELIALMFL